MGGGVGRGRSWVRQERGGGWGGVGGSCPYVLSCAKFSEYAANHFQYLFLLRQLDNLTELTTFLTYDTINILTHSDLPGVPLSPKNLGDTLVVSAVVPQVDMSLVMPPPNFGKDSMAGDIDSFLPDSSSTADLQDLGSPGCDIRNSASEHSIIQRLAEAEAAATTSNPDITKSYSVDQLISPQPPPPVAPCPVPPATANGSICQSPGAKHSPSTTHRHHHRHHHHPSPPSIVKNTAGRQLSSSLTNLQASQLPHPHDGDINGPGAVHLNLHGNINAGFSTMRKGLTSGFTNLMSTLESAVKTSPEDVSDTLSVRSDISSDSDNFVLVNIEQQERQESSIGGGDALFRMDHKHAIPAASVELASEVFEEPTNSEMSDITTSFRRKDPISVVTVRVSRVQLVQESRGYESTTKLQCCHLTCHECTSMAFHEFQTKFSSRCRGWSDSLASAPDPCCLKVRLETQLVQGEMGGGHREAGGKGEASLRGGSKGEAAGRGDETLRGNSQEREGSREKTPLRGSSKDDPVVQGTKEEAGVKGATRPSEDNGGGGGTVVRGISGAPLPVIVLPSLKAQVGDLNLAFMTSTISNLIDLIEDEMFLPPLPMEIEVERIRLRLIEDRVPANISSPGSVPTQLCVPRLLLTRDTRGIFTVLPHPKESVELRRARDEKRRLEDEVRRLRSELAASQDDRRTLQATLTKMREEKEQQQQQRSSRGFSLPKFPLP